MAKQKAGGRPAKISNAVYEAELFRLQSELVKVQRWATATGARIIVIFEGRDARGQGRGDQ
ncbi:MAG: polyphosphate kinase 2, partial [Cellulomonas sp.]|nr:polyphosphate kinase 2 [Cellulomonas sp.]